MPAVLWTSHGVDKVDQASPSTVPRRSAAMLRSALRLAAYRSEQTILTFWAKCWEWGETEEALNKACLSTSAVVRSNTCTEDGRRA